MNRSREAVNPIRFLAIRLIWVCVLTLCIFAFLAVYMNRKTEGTIEHVGSVYMTSMSEQITLHFQSIIDLRVSQLDAIVQTITPEGSRSEEELRSTLQYTAEARGFNYLALYTQDGQLEMIYGDTITLEDPESFYRSMHNGEKKVAVGVNQAEERTVLIGVPSAYPTADGEASVALVAGLPVDDLSEALSLGSDALVNSHIIRKNGSYVIRGGEAFRESYFDRIRAIFDEAEISGVEQYIVGLRNAMEAGEDYSAVLEIGSERRNLYSTKLPYSEWFLIMVMPYGILDQMVSELSHQLVYMVFLGCMVILLLLIFIFWQYLSLTKRQMAALDGARKEAEKANKAKSEFLSNMSHDIRTPMNAIVGMTAIAIANVDSKEQVQNCLRKIALSSKHLLGLINDVLDMSKIESGKMTLNVDQVSLREVMDSMVNIVQPQIRAKHQHFNIFIHDISIENVCCDSVRLNQVMINLLGNAVKFTPDGGAIHVSLYEEDSEKGEEYIRTHIVVKDTGIGMSKEYQEKIFDSFSREDTTRVQKTEGTGLGMTITKYIVDAMGGTIQVESELGKGSEFHIILDLLKAEVQEADMVLPSWDMLVVDDDEQLCESVVASLKAIGLNPDWCLDAETAIQMVGKRHKLHQDYHIILLDWKLPNMDGITAAREIRRLYGDNIPILLISAYDWSEIEDEARAAGVTGFIPKPLFKSTLFYGLKPFMSDLTQEGQENESALNKRLEGRRILLAEDNDLNWEIAEELLTSELGLVLDWAENGKICLEKFETSSEGYYDAILMDIRMPVMTGYEATQAIRASGHPDAKRIPIVAMTADAFSEDIQRCLDYGMNAHVAKPIDVKEVAHQLEKFILQA
ncbi:MAG: response regulator [Lawsonibacter sp.]|nr:response regulator [Lawsonibacter sp.]MCI8914407.1 response regulator [Lawsonibacter sp.]